MRYKISSITLLAFIFVLMQNSYSQPQSLFQYAVGTSDYDIASSIAQTTDGGFVMAGKTSPTVTGNSDFYIVKLTASGFIQWSRIISAPGVDEARSVIQTSDGGYAAVGYTNSFGAGSNDMFIVKLDVSGVLQWSKTIGGSNNDYASSILQTTGGLLVVGETGSFSSGNTDMLIVKLDANGTLGWCKTTGTTGYESAYSIIQTTDGGYAIAGPNLFVKFASSDSLQWGKNTGANIYSIIQTTNGGYVGGGMTNGNTDGYVFKIDSSGSFLWSWIIGGNNLDQFRSVAQLNDGVYGLAGITTSFGATVYDVYIARLDANGTLQSSWKVDGGNTDMANSIISTVTGGCAVAGFTRGQGLGFDDMFFIKLDANWNTCGNVQTVTSTVVPGASITTASPVVLMVNPTITTPTPTITTNGNVLTLCSITGIQNEANKIPSDYNLFQNYPNPFNPSTIIRFSLPEASNVKLIVYNATGEQVVVLVNDRLSAGSFNYEFEANKFPSGVYFYKLETDKFRETKKMILLK